MGEDEMADLYIKIASTPSEEMIEQSVNESLSHISPSDMIDKMAEMSAAQTGMKAEDIKGYLSAMGENELNMMIREFVKEQFISGYAEKVKQNLTTMSLSQLAEELKTALNYYSDEDCAKMYEETVEFSPSTYDQNLSKLGMVNVESPSRINLFASSFENKDIISESIENYNSSVEELKEIHYTDVVGILMSSVTTIINAITYVLIAFVAVSLVVSSIMIGVITLISVQERTKEIGILRAIGASKRNVSSMFNAETVIIGFTSGMLGVIVTYILCIPINAILHKLTDMENLSARLPIHVAAILVLISMFLTLLAGIIPSRSAAKKDPVVALRTE